MREIPLAPAMLHNQASSPANVKAVGRLGDAPLNTQSLRCCHSVHSLNYSHLPKKKNMLISQAVTSERSTLFHLPLSEKPYIQYKQSYDILGAVQLVKECDQWKYIWVHQISHLQRHTRNLQLALGLLVSNETQSLFFGSCLKTY